MAILRDAPIASASVRDKALFDVIPDLSGASEDAVQPPLSATAGLASRVAYDDLVKDRFRFGSPDEIADLILDLVRRAQFPGMSRSMVLDEMQMLAEEVFPMVRTGL